MFRNAASLLSSTWRSLSHCPRGAHTTSPVPLVRVRDFCSALLCNTHSSPCLKTIHLCFHFLTRQQCTDTNVTFSVTSLLFLPLSHLLLLQTWHVVGAYYMFVEWQKGSWWQGPFFSQGFPHVCNSFGLGAGWVICTSQLKMQPFKAKGIIPWLLHKRIFSKTREAGRTSTNSSTALR